MSGKIKYFIVVNRYCQDKIEGWEITGKNYFVAHYLHPEWPGMGSGVTIGIGYDLGYVTILQFYSDFGALLPVDTVKLLSTVVGLKGTDAEDALQRVHGCTVGYDAAINVFETRSLPYAEKQMLSIYPTAASLPENTYGMLVGMVYNRGTSTSGDRRIEIRAIQSLVIKKDIDGIADRFLSMRRLWPKTSGLYTRYTEAAEIIRSSKTA